MRTLTLRVFFGAVLVGGVAVGWALAQRWSGGGRADEAVGTGDVLATGESSVAGGEPPGRAWNGEPLFPFENLYLEGRSDWFRERFDRDRRALRELSGQSGGAVDFECIPKVLREPFTEGEWLELLPEGDRALRRLSESHVVETAASIVVEGVPPPELLLYLACSDFRTQLEDGKVSVDWVFPGEAADADCLEALPSLEPQQLLTRERWRRALAKPTDVWFLNEASVEDELWTLVYEAWRNCGDVEHATVRMASGQYAIVHEGSGSRLSLRSYYCGQEIPPLMDGIVVRMTRGHYENVAATLRREAPRWEPDARAREWLEGWAP